MHSTAYERAGADWSARVRSTPTWFRGADRMLAGWIHLPSTGKARGGVVVCPPLGRESIIGYQTIRALSCQVASYGFVALRFDYAGTGDSADARESGVPQWIDSIRGATDFLRESGCHSISLVGLRMGATLAAAAAPTCGPLASLTLWDPVAGRSFLREQAALQTLEIGPQPARDDAAAEALGFTYSAPVFAQMQSLRLDEGALADVEFENPVAGPCVVLLRPGQRSLHSARWMVGSELVTVLDAPEQEELLNHRSFAANIPQKTIARICTSISGHVPTAWCHIDVRAEESAVVGAGPTGEQIVERFLKLGPTGAFGVLSQTPGSGQLGPVLLCVNVATEHHIGPGRAWVELARAAASASVRTIRFDCPGIGDSAPESWDEAELLYPPGRVEDVQDIVRAARFMSDGSMGVVGSCSGAWLAATVGAVEAIDAVWLINQGLWETDPEPIDGRTAEENILRLTLGGDGEGGVAARLRGFVKHHLPYQLWLSLCRLGMAATPEVMLDDLVTRGTKVRLLLSKMDAVGFKDRRGDTGVARLARRGADVSMTVFDAADHALFVEAGRKAILAAVLDDVLRDLRPARGEAERRTRSLEG